jgi:TrmH RNA methyltransferase
MRNKLTEELAVCGYNAVKALAELHPERIHRLFLREDRMPGLSGACRFLAEQKRAYKLCEDEELEKICKSPRHQGVVAMVDEMEIPFLEEADLEEWASKGTTGLVLDSVGNDNNLGAIVRSAAFFGAGIIVLSDQDQEARLTTSAYRVAEGGMEHLRFFKVRRVDAFLKDASRMLVVIGADHRARWRLRDLPELVRKRSAELVAKKSRAAPAAAPDQKPQASAVLPGIAVVVGNEERGLSAEVKAACAALVRVPGTGNMESLNVAQAATLFLHELYEG